MKSQEATKTQTAEMSFKPEAEQHQSTARAPLHAPRQITESIELIRLFSNVASFS
jgi:hypothetical protein